MRRVFIIGAGPAGLTCALNLKRLAKDTEITVFEQSGKVGGRNLSGGILRTDKLNSLLDDLIPGWRGEKSVRKSEIVKDDFWFLPDSKHSFNMNHLLNTARGFNLVPSSNIKNEIISVSGLCRYMALHAQRGGIEILTSCPIGKVRCENGVAIVSSIAQGMDISGKPQDNFLPSEEISANFAVLSDGVCGKVTQEFMHTTGVERKKSQIYSLGVKEIVKVSKEQYARFGAGRVVHALGYPLWSPLRGPDVFGGGNLYDYGEETLAVGIIAALDWKYCDFSPQNALNFFKEHKSVKCYLEGGEVIECGAKLIPEGGYYSIPRNHSNNIGCEKTILLVGDSAGFVDMLDIKGLHNAMLSGAIAAETITLSMDNPENAADIYTAKLKESSIWKELLKARNFRQTISNLGVDFGLPFSLFSNFLPSWSISADRESLSDEKYPFKSEKKYDRDYFTAMANVACRDDQQSHVVIKNQAVCDELCAGVFHSPCLRFCPGGVYERINGVLKAVNPSNCLHCATCENKCPFNNIIVYLPEGASGPNYKNM